MKKKRMYLFVWEDVLRDYTAGLAFAIAPDLETALQELRKKSGCNLELPIEKMKKYPLTELNAFYVYGGG